MDDYWWRLSECTVFLKLSGAYQDAYLGTIKWRRRQKREHFNKRRKLLVNWSLSDANCAREKGGGYLAGSFTSGMKVEMNNQMWLRGEKVTFPLIQIQLTCMAPVIELVSCLFPPVSGRPLGLQGLPGKAHLLLILLHTPTHLWFPWVRAQSR